MANFHPRQDYLLVRPEARRQSDVLAVVSAERMHRGTVVAAGPGKPDAKGRLIPTTVKPGDLVLFADFIDFPRWRDGPDGVEHIIVQEADVAILEADVSDREIEPAAQKVA